jgi:hypothetical protein
MQLIKNPPFYLALRFSVEREVHGDERASPKGRRSHAYVRPHLSSPFPSHSTFPLSRPTRLTYLARSRSCFQRSKTAYSSGDGAAAHQLSEDGKRHQREKERINAEARDWIYYRASSPLSAFSLGWVGSLTRDWMREQKRRCGASL